MTDGQGYDALTDASRAMAYFHRGMIHKSTADNVRGKADPTVIIAHETQALPFFRKAWAITDRDGKPVLHRNLAFLTHLAGIYDDLDMTAQATEIVDLMIVIDGSP